VVAAHTHGNPFYKAPNEYFWFWFAFTVTVLNFSVKSRVCGNAYASFSAL